MPARPLALGLRGPNRVAIGRVRRMVAALRRLGGNLWMVDNAFSGAFVDNVGTTPVTAYADLLGLGTDRLGVLGPELFTGAYTVGASVTATFAGNEATATFVGGPLTSSGVNWLSVTTADVPLGTFCVVEFDAQWVSGSDLQVGAGYTVGRTISAAGNGGVKRRYTATTAAGHANVKPCTFGSDTPGTVWKITVISTRVMSGNHATQSAVASKPSVQRVPKRLGPNLVTAGDGSSLTPWAGSVGYTVTAGAFKGNGSTAAPILKQVVGAQQGKTYRVTFIQAGRTAGNSYLVLGGTQPVGDPNLTANQTYTFDLTPSNASGELAFATPSGTFDGSFDDIAVQEVLEWATVISFDGNNDFLTTGTTTGEQGFVAAAVTVTSLAANQVVFSSGAQAAGDTGLALKIRSTGAVWANRANASTVDICASAAATVSANAPCVIDADYTVAGATVRKDGVVVATSSTAVAAFASANTLHIGAVAGASPTEYLSAATHAGIHAATIPDAATRKTIINGLAALQGRTL